MRFALRQRLPLKRALYKMYSLPCWARVTASLSTPFDANSFGITAGTKLLRYARKSSHYFFKRIFLTLQALLLRSHRWPFQQAITQDFQVFRRLPRIQLQIASLNVSLLSELFVRFSSHRSSKRLLITSRISENILSESSVASSRKCFWRGFLLPHPDVDVPCISVGCLVPYFLSNIAFTLAHVISGEVLGKVNPFLMRICTFWGQVVLHK